MRQPNLTTERLLLSCILQRPFVAGARVVQVFRQQNPFTHKPYRAVYACWVKLGEGELEPLQAADMLDSRAPGHDWLEEIRNIRYAAVTTANWETYLEEVRQYHSWVRLHAGLQNVLYKMEQDHPLESILSDSQGVLDACLYENASQALTSAEALKMAKEDDNYLNVYDTGIECLDQKLGGILAGETVVLGARPGVGKSVLAVNIASNLAARGHGVGFFTAEMTQLEQLCRLIAMRAQINSTVRNVMEALKRGDSRAIEAEAEVGKLPLFWNESSPLWLPDVIATTKKWKHEHDIAAIAIDHVQHMKAPGKWSSRREELTHISNNLKDLSKELKLVTFEACQMNRKTVEREIAGKNQPSRAPLPKKEGLKESGSFEEDADKVVLVHREDRENLSREERAAITSGQGAEDLLLIVDKNRNGYEGKVRARLWPAWCKIEG